MSQTLSLPLLALLGALLVVSGEKGESKPGNTKLGTPHSYSSSAFREAAEFLSADRKAYPEECSRLCRPSCITFMLKLDDLLMKHPPRCKDSINSCSYLRNSSNRTDHPNCSLEDATCLGPVVFDDKVSHLLPDRQALFGFNERCTSFLSGGDRERFRGWPVVSPSSPQPNLHGNSSSQLLFTFCNIVGEECDQCQDPSGHCNSTRCHKILEPFDDGWTTFILSASIPFQGSGAECMDSVKLPLDSGSLCWAQRVSLYYPESCPHCHSSPMIGLGDRFGALEVVSFRTGPNKPCNSGVHGENDAIDAHSGSCINCMKGSVSSGSPNFTASVNTVSEYGVETVSETPGLVVSEPEFSEAGTADAEEAIDAGPDYIEDAVKAGESPEKPPHNTILSNLAISSPIGCAMVLIAAFFFPLKSRRNCRKRRSEGVEEIVYVESADERAIDEILSETDDEADVPTDIEIKDDSETISSLQPPPQQENKNTKARKYRTASLMEMAGKNEVEVLFMEGTHHSS